MSMIREGLAGASGAALEARGVAARYGARPVLEALDFSVARGEIYALLGANGAGKSTTLNLFLGFLRPCAGQVLVQGLDVMANPEATRRGIAYIPESVALYPHLSARENVAYLLDLAGQNRGNDLISETLDAAGLQASAFDRRVADFSKGMRQKVAIALALARRVPVLLLDEPTSGLDPRATAEFNRLLGLMRNRGVAILMVTHDLLSVADVADRIGFLDAGRLVDESRADGIERFDVRALHHRYQRCAAA